MAGAIAEVARQTLAMDFRRIDPRNARIVLVEAGPRMLPAFPPDAIGLCARRRWTRAGVTVMTDTMVTNCDADGVDLNSGRLDASTMIWAAGVMASPAAQWLGAQADRAGRVKVEPDLSVPGHPDIFVIGDAAAVMDRQRQAGAGHRAGRQADGPVCRQTDRSAHRRHTGSKPFRYRHLGDLATIGRRAAVVQLGPLKLRGYIGWWFWGLAHVYFLIGLRNRFVVAFSWLWNYVTFQRGARLIVGGQLKPK